MHKHIILNVEAAPFLKKSKVNKVYNKVLYLIGKNEHDESKINIAFKYSPKCCNSEYYWAINPWPIMVKIGCHD